MVTVLLILIFSRPFISSLAFPALNYLHSLALIVLLIFWLIYRKISVEKLQPVKYPLALFFLTLIVSILFSRSKVTGFTELYKYTGALALFAIGASLKGKEIRRVVFVVVAGGIIIGFLAIHQYLFGFRKLLTYVTNQRIIDPFILDYIENKRAFFPFVTPNALGGYLAMIIPLCLTFKIGLWLTIPLFLALLFTKSVGGLLSLFIGMSVYFFSRNKINKKGITLILGMLAGIGIIFILRSAIQKEYTRPAFSILVRLDYWREALRIIEKHPLTGVGLGNFNIAQSRYAHNSYLQIWAEMGILGIISFLWLTMLILKSASRAIAPSCPGNKNDLLCFTASSASFLIHNLVDFSFYLPELAFLWWIINGFILSLSKDNDMLKPNGILPSSPAESNHHL